MIDGPVFIAAGLDGIIAHGDAASSDRRDSTRMVVMMAMAPAAYC